MKGPSDLEMANPLTRQIGVLAQSTLKLTPLVLGASN